MAETHPHCQSCGRRHEPRDCADTPKGTDSWRRVKRMQEAAKHKA